MSDESVSVMKEADKKLHESEERFRTIVETAPGVLVITDAEGNNLYVSPNCEKVTGYTWDELKGRMIWWVHKDDTPRTKEFFDRTFNKGMGGKDFEYKAVKKNGELWYASSFWEPFRDKDGKILGIVMQTIDITKRKKAEEALKESEERYRGLVELAPDGMVTANMKGVITSINSATLKLTGCTRDEIVGKHFSKLRFLQIRDIPRFTKLLLSIARGKVPKPFYVYFYHKDGTPRCVEWHVGLLKVGDKRVGIQAILRDVTDHKQAEEDLEVRTKILENVENGIVITRVSDGVIVYTNPKFDEMFGYGSGELMGKNNSVINAPSKKSSEETAKEIIEHLNKTDKWRGEVYNIKKDGTPFWCYVTVSTFKHANYGMAWIAVHTDITKRKKAEEERKKAQRKIELQNIRLKKLDRIKTDFLNVTSHELRTPMAAIKGYIQMLLKQKLGDVTPEQKDALNVVLRNTNRLNHLIQDILDISRLESGTMKFIPEKADITKMIKEIVETMQANANVKNIKINTELEEIPELVIDLDRIKQVIMNLLNNAITFSPYDSTINLYTKMKKDDVLFEVQDFGRGIPKNKQKKIFERFYQVDSGMDRKFGGVGLGLSISQGIVNAHGGEIWVDSIPGKGSTFKFTLPLQSVKDAESRFKKEADVFELEK